MKTSRYVVKVDKARKPFIYDAEKMRRRNWAIAKYAEILKLLEDMGRKAFDV